LECKRVKQQVKGGIQQVLKDAPLPICMVGGMTAPLLGSALLTLGRAMGETRRNDGYTVTRRTSVYDTWFFDITSLGRTNYCRCSILTRIFYFHYEWYIQDTNSSCLSHQCLSRGRRGMNGCHTRWNYFFGGKCQWKKYQC
jgi:hypothetical protein